MSEMLELAERCERLEGPNYAIEVEIFKAIHPEYADYVQGRGGLVHRFDGSDQRVLSDIRPGNYTASLDSAMTLVPAGSDIMVDNFDGPHNKRCSASVYSPPSKGTENKGYGKTPALALTAACLRARHHLENSDAQG